ncbi:MAG: excinuclease ABC subunit C [Bacteroidia bacterium]|nr:excinuclease ABC subunit C [Bacteroidia bacterium]MBP7261189.1 excinuclease ABC subunit C [Bacteroidia bacterium]MBP9180595.1 excinuclease ABC subunit C [Bacteroidia bacterium]MBP9724518.1 excinuclease ABC subunit C [Bacteroidia bacterium]
MADFDLKQTILSLPETPGVYRYFDKDNKLIYVGKAKSLKKRVSSYFTKNHHENRKTAVMVSKIVRIEFTLVDSEFDALLLENSLIKKHQPRFNINLRDDKTYPFICIKNERFPRIFPTRNPVKDGSDYFGPYASVRIMHTMLDLIKSLYPTRNCTYVLSEANIASLKYKTCLEFQIGNCKGPCENLQSEADYNEGIKQIKNILRGNIDEVLDFLLKEMQDASTQLHFERAAVLKQKYNLLQNYQSKSTIVSKSIHNVDVFSIAYDDFYAFVNYFKVANGMIIQTHTVEIKKKLDETPAELLAYAIVEIRETFHSNSTEIIVPFEPDIEDERLHFSIPKAGEKKKLLDLSYKNAFYAKKEKLDQYDKLNPEVKTERLLTVMKNDLRLQELPYHIECFDNSNFQGKYPVSAMTVFKNGKPSKKDYRHFNVRTVEGPDDFATMREVIHRRYKRAVEEKQALPQLIIIDGGKGQLSSAVESLKELGVYGRVTVVGIAKRLEELYFPDDELPLYLDKKSETLRVIQQIRDEAHRFGITHHRKRRDKGTLQSELDAIQGIGPSTIELLLKELKSVKKIKEAPLELLEQIVGKAKATLIKDYFKKA